jgi:hypothetical protein
LPVELPISGAPIGIITLKNRKPSPVTQLFIDAAREVAKPLGEGKRAPNAPRRAGRRDARS